MIYKVKYGYMKVVLASLLEDCGDPDLTFKGEDSKEFAVFFGPYGTSRGDELAERYDDALEAIGDAIIDA